MESAGFAVRELRETDAAALARLHVAAWQDTYTDQLPAGFFTPQFLEQRMAMWNRLCQNRPEGGMVAVAVAAGEGPETDRVIGFAVSRETGEDAAPRPTELSMLYVERGSHGSGAGQALLDAVLPQHPVFLWITRDNPRARAFYRRNGFQADGTELIDDPVPGLTSVRMVR